MLHYLLQETSVTYYDSAFDAQIGVLMQPDLHAGFCLEELKYHKLDRQHREKGPVLANSEAVMVR